MSKKNILIFVLLIFIVLILLWIYIENRGMPNSIVGNTKVLTEINRLLLPLEAKNLTANDFLTLSNLVKEDSYASGEVEELVVLTKYGEYSHVGHGLGFLYKYATLGRIPICPGHSLSHYYVFSKHDEATLAANNLADAKESLQNWENIEEQKNSTYLEENNYYSAKELITQKLNNVYQGNYSITDDEISQLSDAPCVYE